MLQVLGAMGGARVEPDPDPKNNGDADIEQRPPGCLFETYLVGLAAKCQKIQHDKTHNHTENNAPRSPANIHERPCFSTIAKIEFRELTP
jgi:hypothetical protein